MEPDEIVRRVGEAVQVADTGARDKALNHIQEVFTQSEIYTSPEVRFSPSQVVQLKEYATSMFEKEHADMLMVMVDMILIGSDYEPKSSMNLWPELFSDNRSHRSADVIVDLMWERGVLHKDETPFFFSHAVTRFHDKLSHRWGLFYLTNKRAISFGRYKGVMVGRSPAHRLYYDDWKSMPYLEAFDFLDYDRIESFDAAWKMGKKHIDLMYNTKYLKVNEQVYGGPLFFKFDFGQSRKLIEGPLKIMVQVDMGYIMHKERHMELTQRFKETVGL